MNFNIIDTATNDKGVEFKAGDRIVIKGSKVERVISQIVESDRGIEVVAKRVTEGAGNSRWTTVANIKHI